MKTKNEMRLKRKLTIRRKISGSQKCPRVAIFRSNTRLYVQFIDDEAGKTLLSAWQKGKNAQAAQELGKKISERAVAKKISTIVFDRAGYRYHGAVRTFAEALRDGGLQF